MCIQVQVVYKEYQNSPIPNAAQGRDNLVKLITLGSNLNM